MEASLNERVAVITGGARGQGRSHALALAEAGATVVVLDVPGPVGSTSYPLAGQEDLDTTVKTVEAAGGRARGWPVDVRDSSAVQEAITATVEEFGRIDILVANAGIAVTGPLSEVTDETWGELIGINLTGVFHCLRAVVPTMRGQRFGRIVVTSSMGGRMGVPNLAAYNATKWGVIGMAKSLALEVAKEGVTVNVVCPCTVATPMVLNDSMYKLFAPDLTDRPGEVEIDPEILHRFRRVNPIPQPWIEAEDVTRAVLYLVTDPGVLTGTVMEIGLGSSARLH